MRDRPGASPWAIHPKPNSAAPWTRDAVRAHRLDAFDDVDVATLLSERRLSIEDALWIGRHLMANGRALASYSDGQAILAEAARAG